MTCHYRTSPSRSCTNNHLPPENQHPSHPTTDGGRLTRKGYRYPSPVPFANVRTPASSIRYCSGLARGITGTLHVTPDSGSMGNGGSGWDEICGCEQRGEFSVKGGRREKGEPTSPVTTPLRPVRRPSTLHQTPPPTLISRINSSRSPGCGNACIAEEEARESTCRCVMRVVWCYIRGAGLAVAKRSGDEGAYLLRECEEGTDEPRDGVRWESEEEEVG